MHPNVLQQEQISVCDQNSSRSGQFLIRTVLKSLLPTWSIGASIIHIHCDFVLFSTSFRQFFYYFYWQKFCHKTNPILANKCINDILGQRTSKLFLINTIVLFQQQLWSIMFSSFWKYQWQIEFIFSRVLMLN